MDTAPVVSSSATPPMEQVEGAEDAPGGVVAGEGAEEVVSISVEELKELSQAVQSLKADQDRTTLEELKEDREEYIEVSRCL